MKKFFRTIVLFAAALILSGIPLLATAQTAISISTSVPGTYSVTAGTNGPGGFIANFYQFALIISGVLAVGIIVYGGIRYMLSTGNPSGIHEAREWIEAAILGILLLAGAYFILSVINPQLLNLNLPALQGANVNLSNIPTPGGTGSTSGGASGAGTGCKNATAGGSGIAGKVDAAALSYCGANTSGGPGGGTVSCAWAVNNVLQQAGIAPLDSTSVASLESALKSGRGTLVNPSQAQPGDIVVQAQDGHVGICVNVGCTQVLSNSSSHASFTWVSNTSFNPSYNGGPGRIYQLN